MEAIDGMKKLSRGRSNFDHRTILVLKYWLYAIRWPLTVTPSSAEFAFWTLAVMISFHWPVCSPFIQGGIVAFAESYLAYLFSHCASPPMCLQLSLVSIIPPNCERDWPQRSCRMFKRLARSDVPLVCKFTKKISSSVRGLYDGVSWLWPDVMEVRDLRPDTKSGDGATIEQQMIDHGGAVPAPVEGMRDSGEGDS